MHDLMTLGVLKRWQNVEKVRQRRSLASHRHGRAFVVLRYYEYAPRAKSPAALPVERRVLARLGWAGQTTFLFEHSAWQLVF